MHVHYNYITGATYKYTFVTYLPPSKDQNMECHALYYFEKRETVFHTVKSRRNNYNLWNIYTQWNMLVGNGLPVFLRLFDRGGTESPTVSKKSIAVSSAVTKRCGNSQDHPEHCRASIRSFETQHDVPRIAGSNVQRPTATNQTQNNREEFWQ